VAFCAVLYGALGAAFVLSPPEWRQQDAIEEVPVINIPPGDRKGNWIGPQGMGSCVHASMISLLRWQGRRDLADAWRYADGESPRTFNRKLDAAGVRYAVITNGDAGFLEWACRTRRGAGVTVRNGAHMVTLVHLTDDQAGLLDNNDPTKINWVPRDDFLAEWRAGPNGGWAVTPIYTPAAPLPQ
jgi:hypothetical protein